MSPVHEKSPYTAETRRYVRSQAPISQPIENVHKRAEGFIRVLASSCKGCLRKGTTDCAVRCPAGGASALVRDYDQLLHPCELAAPHPHGTAGGRPKGDPYGDTIESRKRRKDLHVALAAFGPSGASAAELPVYSCGNARKCGDLTYLRTHGLIEIIGTGATHRYRSLPAPDTRKEAT